MNKSQEKMISQIKESSIQFIMTKICNYDDPVLTVSAKETLLRYILKLERGNGR